MVYLHSLASYIQERLDVEVVGSLGSVSTCLNSGNMGQTYEDDLKEHLLVNLHELLVPLLDLRRLLTGVGLVVVGGRGIVAVVLAPLDHLAEYRLRDVRLQGSKVSLEQNRVSAKDASGL